MTISLRLCASAIFALKLVCCQAFSVLEAEEHREAMQRAQTYAEAKMFDHADAVYNELLALHLSDWQQLIIHYDMGTLALKQGKWSKAIELLSAIDLKHNPLPFVALRVQINLGLAHYRYAHALKLDDQPYDVVGAYVHLKQAGLAFKEALKLSCEMQKLVSVDADCVPVQALRELYLAAQRELAAMVMPLAKERIEIMPLIEGLPWLDYVLGNAAADLSLLASTALPPDVVHEYFRLFASEHESWRVVWEAQKVKLTTLSDKDKAESILAQAQTAYDEAGKAIARQELIQSLAALKKSQDSLGLLMREIFGGDPITGSLQQLLGLYRYILMQDHLRDAYWSNLQKEYDLLKELPLLQQDTINKSLQQMTVAHNAFHEGKTIIARAYLMAAAETVRGLAAANANMTVLMLLRKLITQQGVALNINYMWTEESASDLGDLAIELQHNVVEAAKQFYEQVYREQKEKYKDGFCQSSPWSSALELFENGRQLALLADTQLQVAPRESDLQAIALQEGAIEKWQQALAEIENPKISSRNSCSGGGGGGGKGGEDDKKSSAGSADKKSEEEQKPEASMTELLTVLQQMQQDDRKPKASAPSSSNVAKPW